MKRGRPTAGTAKPIQAEPLNQPSELEEAQEEAVTNEAQSSIDTQERLRRREEERRDAEATVTEYFAEQEAARDRMAKLREARLAAEAENAGKPKAKRQPLSKGKRS